MKQKTLGIVFILLASILWAIETVVAKLAYRTSDFGHTVAIRTIVVAIVAFLYLLFVNILNKSNFKRLFNINTLFNSLKINKKQLPYLVYIAVAGTLFADFIFYFALTKTTAVNANLIAHLQPVFIVLMGFFMLKEDKLTKYDYLGIIVMIFAALLVTTRTVENLYNLRFGTLGDLLVLVSTILWATVSIMGRKLVKFTNISTIFFYRFMLSSIGFILYLVFTSGFFILNIYEVLLGLIVGIGYIFYYNSLKRIKAAQLGALELSTPFFTAIFAFFILKEVTTIMQISGILLLFIGIYFLAKKEEQPL